MNLSKLSFSQLVNFSLAAFLLIGIAVTTYSVNNLNTLNAEAAKGGNSGNGGGGNGGGKNSTASIALDQTSPKLGDSVTFTTSGGRRIALACYPYTGGLTIIYSADQQVGTSFLLGGADSTWKQTGQDATCYAWLYNNNLSRGALASTVFFAAGSQ